MSFSDLIVSLFPPKYNQIQDVRCTGLRSPHCSDLTCSRAFFSQLTLHPCSYVHQNKNAPKVAHTTTTTPRSTSAGTHTTTAGM